MWPVQKEMCLITTLISSQWQGVILATLWVCFPFLGFLPNAVNTHFQEYNTKPDNHLNENETLNSDTLAEQGDLSAVG